MSLNNIQDNAYFNFLLENEEELLKEIITSKGFILEVLKKKGMLPSLDLLINNINVFNVQFILNNYKLNEEENIRIMKVLNEDLVVEYRKKLSSKEIESQLINGEAIDKKAILSVEQINKYKKEIEEQFNLESSIESVLKKSVKKFTPEQLLSVNEKFLINNRLCAKLGWKMFFEKTVLFS